MLQLKDDTVFDQDGSREELIQDEFWMLVLENFTNTSDLAGHRVKVKKESRRTLRLLQWPAGCMVRPITERSLKKEEMGLKVGSQEIHF